MFLANSEYLPDLSIKKTLGLVSGNTIRAKHVGIDILAGLKTLIGGELKGYSTLLNESRNEAKKRMIEEAEKLGANGIINIRFATSNVTHGASEILVYGTAVVIEEFNSDSQ